MAQYQDAGGNAQGVELQPWEMWAKNMHRLHGIDAYKKYWEPVVQSIGTMIPQIAGSYKDPVYTLVR